MVSPRLISKALRVDQWTKNVLVLAAPAAAGVLLESAALIATLIALASFSFLASSLYLVNDIRDIEADRRHPRKRLRPLASGQLPVGTAAVIAALSAAASLALALVLLPVSFVWVLAAYAANTLLYSWWGKHVPTVDVIHVALGFVLRAVAGAAATGVPLSQWFLAAAMFGSLMVVAGKRSSEVAHVDETGSTRAVLSRYSGQYLQQVMVISAAALLLTYALWALGEAETPIRAPWALISFAPFVYSVFRYMQLSDGGEAEQPERLILFDRGLQVGGFLWALSIAIGIYA